MLATVLALTPAAAQARVEVGTTSLVSFNHSHSAGAKGSSGMPSLSSDGRFVTFVSGAPGGTDLVDPPLAGWGDVWRRELSTGTLDRVSATRSGMPTTWITGIDGFAVSADGQRVLFHSGSGDLTDQPIPHERFTGQPMTQLFVRDFAVPTTFLVSWNADNTAADNGAHAQAVLSADGRWVAFVSNQRASNDPRDTNFYGRQQIWRRDTALNKTVLVSRNESNYGSDDWYDAARPAISAGGRFVVFASEATDLVSLPRSTTGRVQQIYRRDMTAETTTLVSVAPDGFTGNRVSHGAATVSADGEIVAFSSRATNLTTDAVTGDVDQIFVRDLRPGGKTTLISGGQNGSSGANGSSGGPVVSADGRFVAFVSTATDLADTPVPAGTAQLYVHDREDGTTALVSRALGAQQGADRGAESQIGLSADGDRVVFASRSRNLTADALPADSVQVYVRDLTPSSPERLSISRDQISAPAGDDIQVIASLRDSAQRPLANREVKIEAPAKVLASCAVSPCVTGADGNVSFTVRGTEPSPPLAEDRITIWRDTGGDGQRSVSDPQAQLTATWQRLQYTALGDSLSSGEGNPDFDGPCHRSPQHAFVRLLDFPDYSTLRHVACTGANTDHVLTLSYKGEPEQISQVRSDDRLITVSAGINDLDFDALLKSCVMDKESCNPCEGDKKDHCDKGLRWADLPSRIAALSGVLPRLYEQLHAKAGQARILVIGYPHLFPRVVPAKTCAETTYHGAKKGIDTDEMGWLNRLAIQLNQVIASSVEQARLSVPRLRFVDANTDFNGHEICTGTQAWIHGIVVGGIDVTTGDLLVGESFHPNNAGHQAYARLTNAALAGALADPAG